MWKYSTRSTLNTALDYHVGTAVAHWAHSTFYNTRTHDTKNTYIFTHTDATTHTRNNRNRLYCILRGVACFEDEAGSEGKDQHLKTHLEKRTRILKGFYDV